MPAESKQEHKQASGVPAHSVQGAMFTQETSTIPSFFWQKAMILSQLQNSQFIKQAAETTRGSRHEGDSLISLSLERTLLLATYLIRLLWKGRFQRYRNSKLPRYQRQSKRFSGQGRSPHPEELSQAYSRCGGMIFTLISLVALGVVLRGLYFFSAGGAASPGAAVALQTKRKNSQKNLAIPTSFQRPRLLRNLYQYPYLCRLRGMGFRLYLSDTTTVLEFFFTGTKDGVSSSSPGEKHVDFSSHCSSMF